MSALRPYSTRFREGTNQVLWVAVEPDPTPDGRAAFAPDRWMDPIPHKSVGMRENLGPVWAPNGREMAAIVDGFLTTYPVGARRHARPVRRAASPPTWRARRRGRPIRASLLYQAADRFRLVDLVDGGVRDIVPQWSWTAPPVTTTTTVHAGRLFSARAGAGGRDGDGHRHRGRTAS